MKILITGASSGIGQATAYKFATAGADLILTYSKNKFGAEKTQEKCQELGAKSVKIFELDLSNEQSILDFVEKIINKYKNIDILINNAGFLSTGKIETMKFADIDQSVTVNLTGLIKLTTKLLPVIKNTIINIGSGLAYQSKKEFSIYCASKHGVRGFTKSIAKEYPDLKIYLVNPGLVATQMTNFAGTKPEIMAQIIFNLINGKYKVKSGADVNMSDYLQKNILRRIKNFVKKAL
jgi:short-subunit dehydrogenase